MRIALVLGVTSVLLSAACKEPVKESAPTATSAAPSKAIEPTTASATAAAFAPNAGFSASAAAVAPKHTETCEVEIFGKVNLPKDLAKDKRVIVYVAQDDCLADTSQILGHVNAGSDGGIVLEVFPKWGSDVTICAAVDEGEGKPTTRYGKAKGKFHAEAEGEVTFADVKIDLEKGKPHTFPKDAGDVKPAKAPSGTPPAASASGSASAKK